ncbi:MAG: DinB family protein [Chloroflexi bacterium]|nr:DinB family protein [Chloroflexota bacterium]
MDVSQLFLQRYDALYNFWIGDLWVRVTDDLMRQRPDPRVNSIAWNLWHLTRVEDAGLNRFVTDRTQVLDEGAWMEQMNIPWRHMGGEMTFAEVDELNQRIDLAALQAYSAAVQVRTREIVTQAGWGNLDAAMEADHLHVILVDEGLAHSHAAGLLENYLGWTKGKCLMNFGLTHPYQHVGEIGVIASLLGVTFD